MTRLSWPSDDPAFLVQEEVAIVVQVNGKKRAEITVPADAPEDHVKETALADPNVMRFTEGMTIRKVILVPKKLVERGGGIGREGDRKGRGGEGRGEEDIRGKRLFEKSPFPRTPIRKNF